MFRDLGWDVPDSAAARELWADFSFPKNKKRNGKFDPETSPRSLSAVQLPKSFFSQALCTALNPQSQTRLQTFLSQRESLQGQCRHGHADIF